MVSALDGFRAVHDTKHHHPHEPINTGTTPHDDESVRVLEVFETLARILRVQNHTDGAYDGCRVNTKSWKDL